MELPSWKLHSQRFIQYRFVVYAFMENRIKRGGAILNAGCGPLFDAPEDCILKVQAVGVDISRSNIMKAKALNKGASFIVADITALPFAPETFDGISSIDVLEHVQNKKKAVDEFARVTKSGGFFVGCTTNLCHPVLLLDSKLPMLMKPFVDRLAPGHYERHSRFTPYQFSGTFTHAGYQIEKLVLSHSIIVDLINRRYISYLVILFQRITQKPPLLFFKEMMIMQATKQTIAQSKRHLGFNFVGACGVGLSRFRAWAVALRFSAADRSQSAENTTA